MDKSYINQLTEEYHLLKEELLFIQEDIQSISNQLQTLEAFEANVLYKKLISLRITAANLRIKMGKLCCKITKSKAGIFKIPQNEAINEIKAT